MLQAVCIRTVPFQHAFMNSFDPNTTLRTGLSRLTLFFERRLVGVEEGGSVSSDHR
jgi:hypothetical protein